MGQREAGIGPEEDPGKPSALRMVLDKPHQRSAQSPAALIGPDVQPVHFGGRRLRTIDGNACADAPALVLDDPECSTIPVEGRTGSPQIRQVVMRVDEAARIIGETEGKQAE
jgi:hypothetical protein